MHFHSFHFQRLQRLHLRLLCGRASISVGAADKSGTVRASTSRLRRAQTFSAKVQLPRSMSAMNGVPLGPLLSRHSRATDWGSGWQACAIGSNWYAFGFCKQHPPMHSIRTAHRRNGGGVGVTLPTHNTGQSRTAVQPSIPEPGVSLSHQVACLRDELCRKHLSCRAPSFWHGLC